MSLHTLTAKKLYKSQIRSAKTSYWNRIKNEISACNSPSRFWNAIRQFTQTNFLDNSASLDMAVSSEYFTQMFNCFPFNSPIVSIGLSTHIPCLDNNISISELQCAFQRFKQNKAPGLDRITGEFYKGLNNTNQQFLLDYFNKILQLEQTPIE